MVTVVWVIEIINRDSKRLFQFSIIYSSLLLILETYLSRATQQRFCILKLLERGFLLKKHVNAIRNRKCFMVYHCSSKTKIVKLDFIYSNYWINFHKCIEVSIVNNRFQFWKHLKSQILKIWRLLLILLYWFYCWT